jgi:hypothetical protein
MDSEVAGDNLKTMEPHVHNFAIYGCWCGARQCKQMFIPWAHLSWSNMFCKEIALEGSDYCLRHSEFYDDN